ncbi:MULTISPECIES: accessory gene regulator ArgB-like protein [Clostridium]|uniref:accessory gene regulator ArgB-like protein n=1 Tax=Clostridium TaxID=1485 RepID=UPI00214A6450|nr:MULTISPECIES: accessory gene regulator B family protein [Clostridium]MCR1951710.1 accessory gene regulator B family protein [Clostridium sp. DSM 100503]MDI9218849.1 accessory gene regulator B family protein [Clostridium tertium]
MYNIEKLSKNIAYNLKDELRLEDEKTEIIEYGLHALIHMFISVLLVVIFGYIFNVMIESLIISFTISIFRRSSGGAHARTSLNCAIIGVLIAVIPSSLLSKIVPNINYVIALGIIIFTVSLLITYKLAPVDTPNKPIKKLEKIKRLKKASIITLVIYMLIIIINLLLYKANSSEILLIYSICIYVGVVWQVFTLTNTGHYIINLIDTFLIKVLSFWKEGSKNEKDK